MGLSICYRTSNIPSSRFKLLYCSAKQTERLLVDQLCTCNGIHHMHMYAACTLVSHYCAMYVIRMQFLTVHDFDKIRA